MKLIWFKNREEKEITRFKNLLMGSKEVLDRLNEILKEKEDELIRSMRAVDTYDIANWSHLQAHKNGYLSCLANIKELINLDQKEIN